MSPREHKDGARGGARGQRRATAARAGEAARSGAAARSEGARSGTAARSGEAARSGAAARSGEGARSGAATRSGEGARSRDARRARPGFYELRLYIAGRTARSEAALRNLESICETHLRGKYRIEVVDLLQSPQLARGDQIFAVPTLVRQLPPPVKKIIGDLSNVERVLVGLDLRPVAGRTP